MLTLIQRLGVACLAIIIFAGHAFATDIDLVQTGGKRTKLGGDGDAAKVTVVSGSGVSVGGCTPTVAAPTYVEAVANALSCTLTGALRVTLETLLAGEDLVNNLIMTSGGATRITQILGTGGVPSTATDATSATSALPVGVKTFQGIVTCTGTCVQTQKIYGTYANAATVAASVLLCTLTLSDTTTATSSCNVQSNWAHYFVVTTATSGTTPLAGVFAMY